MSFLRPATLAVACLALFPLLASAAAPIPLPWKAGLKLAYDSTSIDERENKDVHRTTTTTMTTTIEVSEAGEQGVVQVWRDNGAQVRVEGNAPNGAAEEKEALDLQKRFENVPVQITLDAQGVYTGVRNWESLGNKLREALTPMLMAQARKQAEGQGAVDEAALKERVQPVIDRMTGQAAVNAMVGKNPMIYNLFTAPALKPGEPVSYEDAMPSPFSDDRIPTIGTFELVADDMGASTATIRWHQDVDPAKGADVMWKILESVAGPMPGAARDGLPKEILLKDEATVVLDRATGVPQRLEYVRRIELGSAKRKMTWNFVLRKADPSASL